MNQILEKWGDPLVLLFSLVLTLVMIIIARKRSGKQIHALVAFPFFFGPVILFVAICFHLLQNGVQTVDGLSKSSTYYNFRVYSLLFFGVMLAYLAFQLLQASLAKCLNPTFKHKQLFMIMAKILLMTLPLLPIIPLAVIPAFGCFLNLVSLPFARKKVKTVPLDKVAEMPLAASA